MALQFIDRYSSTLSSGYTSGGTTLVVSSATNLPSDGATDFYLIVEADGVNTEEVFHVTNKSGTTLTVVGARANTVASNHGAGAVVIGSIMTVAAFTQYTTDVQAGSGGLTQIAQVVTAASQTSVHFASIPGSYSNLRVVYVCRSQGAVSTDSLYMELNSDTTAADYTATQFILGNGASISAGTAAATTAGGFVNNAPGTSATANYPAIGTLVIPAYAKTTFNKKWHHAGDYAQSGTNDIKIETSGTFISAAAITDMIFSLTSSRAFVDGSVFTLYGEK